ncbi:MAG: hypothetical protein M3P14_00465 [Chloroflexota bacterium]|nr:hypothetical protein [Chloroflexota bacterium]
MVTLPAADGMPAVTAVAEFVVIDWLRLGPIFALLLVLACVPLFKRWIPPRHA